jgi:hypothetical protein
MLFLKYPFHQDDDDEKIFAINFKIPINLLSILKFLINNFKIQMQFPVKDLEPTEDGDQTSEVNQQVEPPEDEDYFHGTFAPADSANSSVFTL